MNATLRAAIHLGNDHDVNLRNKLEMWKDMSEAAQRKEKQECAVEKPKLDNAWRLRGIYFIDPADAEFKEL